MELIDKAEVLAAIENAAKSNPLYVTIAEKDAFKDGVNDALESVLRLEVKARIEESQPTHFATTASDELCKAADEYVHSTLVGSLSIKKNAFKAGANWQLDQMMKTAVIGLVHPDDAEVWVSKRDLADYHEDEKVMVIIRKIE